jgi:hypothetical protein
MTRLRRRMLDDLRTRQDLRMRDKRSEEQKSQLAYDDVPASRVKGVRGGEPRY